MTTRITDMDRHAVERDFAVRRMKYWICPDGTIRRLNAFEVKGDELLLEMMQPGDSVMPVKYTWHLSEVDKKFEQFSAVTQEQAMSGLVPTPVGEKKPRPAVVTLSKPQTPALVEARAEVPTLANEPEPPAELSQLDGPTRSLMAWGEEIAPTQKIQEGLMELFERVRGTPTDRNLTQAKTAVEIVGKMIEVSKIRIDAIRLANDLKNPKK